MTLLNLGCGEQVSGTPWANVDIDPRYGDVYRGDVRMWEGLPFAASYFDGVACHHVLDLFTDDELPEVLREIRRVLRPGARLRVSVIDPLVGFARWVERDGDWLDAKVPNAISHDEALCRWLTWHGTRRQLWTPTTLCAMFERHGWGAIHWFHGLTGSGCPLAQLDSREDESFFVEAIPPD